MLTERFNPNTKIKFKAYVGLRMELLPYVDFLIANNTSENNSEVSEEKLSQLKPEMMDFAKKMKQQANTALLDIQEQLIKDFFSLSNEEFNEISLQEFEQLWTMIMEVRKAEIDFLLFNTLSSKV